MRMLGKFAVPIKRGYGYNCPTVKVIGVSALEYLVKDWPWNSAVWAPREHFVEYDGIPEDKAHYTNEEWNYEIPYEYYAAVVEYESNRDKPKPRIEE